MTLIELMIVLVILVLLVTISTTMLQPLLADRELREAAREVNAMIAGGPARAAERGYPAGVWLQRSANVPNAVLDIFFAEVPPPFAGDLTNSACTCQASGAAGLWTVTFVPSTTTPALIANMVAPGDTIRMNYQGPAYRITAVNGGGTSLTIAVDTKVPPLAHNTGVPFQIDRQPRKSSISPLEMPGSTCVDLAMSGLGASGVEFATGGTQPVVITFSPQGNVDRVYYQHATNGFIAQAVTGNIHLLVGTVDKVTTYTPFDTDENGTPDDDATNDPTELSDNHADRNNRWISIGHQSGTVITTENMAGTVESARQFAISGQGMGGR